MKISRIIIILVVVVIIAIVLIYAFSVLLAPKESSSAWNPAGGYPLQAGGSYGVGGQQCFNNTTYITCVGGQDVDGGPTNTVYSSSPLSSSSGNITGWTSESPYPQNIDGQACAVSSGYVYCVGGTYDDSGDDVATSYFAPLASSGTVGNWGSTTAYPIPIDTESCVASTAYIYCIGGANETDATEADATSTSSVWYAPISSSGIGTWVHTTSYPENVYYPTCFVANGYVYCLGGADSNDNSLSTDYYAPLSSSGVGTWTQTTAYPVQETGQACVISSGYIYCVGGETNGGSSNSNPSYTNAVYYAPVSVSGIGTWKQAGVYPNSVGTNCALYSGAIYCVGGFENNAGETNAVYYSSLTALTSVKSG
jgi:hypothetical protein